MKEGPLKLVCGIQMLRGSEWIFIDTMISIFRSIKASGVKINSKTGLGLKDILSRCSLSLTSVTSAQRVLLTLGLLWTPPSAPNARQVRFNIKISRLNDLVQAYKALNWFNRPALIPVLNFGYYIGTATIEAFRGEVYNNHGVLNESLADETLYTIDRNVSGIITVTLTDKGRLLMRNLLAFTDLIDVWSDEPNDLFDSNKNTHEKYDPEPVEFLGLTLNQNRIRPNPSTNDVYIVVYINTKTKEFVTKYLRIYNYQYQNLFSNKRYPTYFINSDPDDMFLGWTTLPKEYINDHKEYVNTIATKLESQGYTNVHYKRTSLARSYISIKTTGYWLVVQHSPSVSGMGITPLIPYIETKLAKRVITPSKALIDHRANHSLTDYSEWVINHQVVELSDGSSDTIFAMGNEFGWDKMLTSEQTASNYKSKNNNRDIPNPEYEEVEEV